MGELVTLEQAQAEVKAAWEHWMEATGRDDLDNPTAGERERRWVEAKRRVAALKATAQVVKAKRP